MSALGRLVAKTFRKEMGDVFADYGLKSEDVVSESPLGQTKAKPAAAFIKQMQKEGVSTEEMRDLGLLDDFDPKTGPRRQEKLTKDQMLEEINQRRAERLESRGVYRGDVPINITGDETEGTVDLSTKKIPERLERPELPIRYDSIGERARERLSTMTGFQDYNPNLGDPDTYEEITYGLRRGPEAERAEVVLGEGTDPNVIDTIRRSPESRGLHYPIVTGKPRLGL